MQQPQTIETRETKIRITVAVCDEVRGWGVYVEGDPSKNQGFFVGDGEFENYPASFQASKEVALMVASQRAERPDAKLPSEIVPPWTMTATDATSASRSSCQGLGQGALRIRNKWVLLETGEARLGEATVERRPRAPPPVDILKVEAKDEESERNLP